MRHLLFVVNVDWFFKSHRLPLAIEALSRGYSVSLITENTGLFSELQQHGIKCYDLKFGRGYSNPFSELKNLFLLIKYYKSLEPDVIHHITLKPYLYGSFVAVRILKKKILIVNAITGLGYLFTANKKSYLGQILKLLITISIPQKNSIRYIFQNIDDYSFFQKIIYLNRKNVFLIKGAGVDCNYFIKKNISKQSNDIKIRVTLVARILKDKGILEFVNAANILKNKLYGKCEFLIVGGLDLENPSSLSQSDLYNLLDNNYIIWLGNRNDIKEIYQESHIACLPSYREGLPKSIIEAMAMSLPIITTNAPGCRECVQDGVNGFLVPVGDYLLLSKKILQLVENENIRIKMGIESRKKMVSEFSLSHIIAQTFLVYEK